MPAGHLSSISKTLYIIARRRERHYLFYIRCADYLMIRIYLRLITLKLNTCQRLMTLMPEAKLLIS